MFVMRVWCGSSQVKSITDRCSTIGANPTSQGGLVDCRRRKFRHSRENRMSFSKGPRGPPRTDTRLNDCMIIGVRLSLVWAGSRQSTLAAHLGRLKSHKQTFLLNAFGVDVWCRSVMCLVSRRGLHSAFLGLLDTLLSSIYAVPSERKFSRFLSYSATFRAPPNHAPTVSVCM